ncbi:MAG: hypothetical protein H7331_06815 [Bacteroidia bacterium]|nr:hypothetical protein [Bacteroidia bacterium]
MNNIISISLLALVITSSALAQDIIKIKKGPDIKGLVTDMTYFSIIYKLYDKQDSGTFTLQKAEIRSITFADGRVESFNDAIKTKDTIVNTKTEDLYTRDATSTYSNNDQNNVNNNSNISGNNYIMDCKMAKLGTHDAEIYYTKGREAAIGTGTTAVLLGPLLGLVPAIVITKNPIRDKNLGYPNRQLMNNEAYSKAYRDTAERKKHKQTWKGYAVGSGVRVGLILVYVIAIIAIII